jgi:hypothetical protein
MVHGYIMALKKLNQHTSRLLHGIQQLTYTFIIQVFTMYFVVILILDPEV